MTKKENFMEIRNILVSNEENAELVKFIDHEIELLDKKSASRKPTKVQRATAELKDILLDVLNKASKPLTILEIQSADDRLKVYNGEVVSNQRITAILTKLGDGEHGAGIVHKKVVNRKNYYAIDGIIDIEVSND